MSDLASAPLRSSRPALSVSDIVEKIGSDQAPNPLIYWTDLIGSASIGWTCFAIAGGFPLGSAPHCIATLAAILGLLRAAVFVHELSHVKPGQLPGFRIFWNAAVGIPLLIPSMMYAYSHTDHHSRTGFGTHDDPEYAQIARWSRLRIVTFVFTVALLPLALPLRWGVIGPLSRVIPSLRPFVVGKLSTLTINAGYVRGQPRGVHARRWAAQEAAAAIWVWAVAGATLVGLIPLGWLVQWCLVIGGILTINQVRTLVAHGYENDGGPMDARSQLLDSINLRGWPILMVLVAPVGLRFHALHHFLPFLPYHRLGYVHRHLLSELPQNAPYRATARDSVGALKALWQHAAP
jgi:fatty acid desaturase